MHSKGMKEDGTTYYDQSKFLQSFKHWSTWDPTGVNLSQTEIDLEEPDHTTQDENGSLTSLLSIIDIDKLLAMTAYVLLCPLHKESTTC